MIHALIIETDFLFIPSVSLDANMKFFDGMDDDGSESNFLSFCLILYSFWYSVLFLNSPLVRVVMMMNGEIFFQILETVGNSTRTWKFVKL